MNVMLVSQSFMVRASISNLFKEEFDIKNIKEMSFLDKINYNDLKETKIIFIDINDASMTEICKINRQKNKYNELKVIVFDKNKDIFLKCIDINVDGYILDSETKNELIYGIGKVIEGSKYYDTCVFEEIILNSVNEKIKILTLKENEVLGEIINNKNNKEIATALNISENTVKRHISKVFSKLGVQNRQEAIGYYNSFY